EVPLAPPAHHEVRPGRRRLDRDLVVEGGSLGRGVAEVDRAAGDALELLVGGGQGGERGPGEQGGEQPKHERSPVGRDIPQTTTNRTSPRGTCGGQGLPHAGLTTTGRRSAPEFLATRGRRGVAVLAHGFRCGRRSSGPASFRSASNICRSVIPRSII